MERLKLETIENIIGVEKITIEAFEKHGECASLDKCILMGMEELKQYRIAEEQGMLLRLPCKVGDTVYGIVEHANGKIEIVDSTLYGIEQILQFKDVIGKGLYLTKEEAEQALAKRKEV